MSTLTAHSTADLLQNVDKRILIAVLGFAVAVVIGATSLVSAETNGNGDKPTKEWCAAQSYSNYGQCVSQWAKGHGYGYGG